MKKKLCYCLFTILLLSACGQESGSNKENFAIQKAGYDAGENESKTQSQAKSKWTENLKLIKNGELSFQVQNLTESAAQIRQLSTKMGGYVSKDYSASNERNSYATLEIRLPNENFDAFMDFAAKAANGQVERKVDVQDITKEFVDYELRLNAAKKAQERYLELLKKANKVEDMLLVEEKLQRVLAEIESIEGQLRYYEDKVSLSTIQVEMYTLKEAPVEVEEGFWYDLINAFKRGWNLVLGLLVAMAHLWVFIPVVIAGIWWYRKRKA